MQTEEYQKMRDQEDHYWWFVARRRLALTLLADSVRPDATVLDLGSGTGAVLAELQARYQAVGMDFSPHALAFSRERGLKLLVGGDAEACPFADASFDAVVTLDTLEHVRNDAKAVSEIYRILRPGGVLIMNVPAFRWLWGPHDVALMHFRRYTKPQVCALLRSAGLDVKRASYSVFLLFPVVVAIRILERFRRGPAKVRLPNVSSGLNRRLLGLMEFEGRLWQRGNLPYGSSLVAIATKPLTSSDSSA